MRQPDRLGYFGRFGGRFVPETLMAALEELQSEYAAARKDRAFGKNCGNSSRRTREDRHRFTMPPG